MFLLLLRPAVGASASSTLGPPFDELIAQLDGLAQSGRFSGEITISVEGRVVASRTFGARSGDTIPSQNALFRVGSVTKGFTAAAIGRLADRGVLSPDDPLAKHFPEVDPARLRRAGRDVRLDDLLTHTSGLTNLEFPAPWGRSETPASIVARLKGASLRHTPGATFSYSNAGYVILGEVIRRASGISYEAFLRRAFLVPLALTNTGITLDSAARARLAPGHVASLVGLHVSRRLLSDLLPGDYEWAGGADGAVFSTSADLVRWVEAIAGHRVLGAERQRWLWSPRHNHYARGWVVETPKAADEQLVWHNGELTPLGYQSFLAWFPARRVAVAITANVDSSAFDLTSVARAALVGRPMPPAASESSVARLLATYRVLHVGPVAAFLMVVIALLVSRRRRPWPRLLSVWAGAFGLAAVLLSFAHTRDLLAGVAIIPVLSAVTVARRSAGLPGAVRSEAISAVIVAVLSSVIAAFSLWLRFGFRA